MPVAIHLHVREEQLKMLHTHLEQSMRKGGRIKGLLDFGGKLQN